MNRSSDFQNSFPPSSGPDRSRAHRRLVSYAQHERPASQSLEEFSEVAPRHYRHAPEYSQGSSHRQQGYYSQSSSPGYEGLERDHRRRAGDVRIGSGAPDFGAAQIELALRGAGIEDDTIKSSFRSVCQGGRDNLLLHLFAMTYNISERQNKLSQRLDAVQKDVQHLNRAAGTISKNPFYKTSFMEVCRHMTTEFTTSYGDIAAKAETYIWSNPDSYSLRQQLNNLQVRKEVKGMLPGLAANVRSDLHKIIKKSDSLEQMTNAWWSKFCIQKRDSSPPPSLFASFALLRVTHRKWAEANPHLDKTKKAPEDRGFWERVDTQLKALVKEHGADRAAIGSTWPIWESQIIHQDAGYVDPSSFMDEDGYARYDGPEGEPRFHDESTDARLPAPHQSGDTQRPSRASSGVPDDRRSRRAASAAPYGTDRDASPAYPATSFTQSQAADGAHEWSRPSRSSSTSSRSSSRSSSPPRFVNSYTDDAHHPGTFRGPSIGPSFSTWQPPQPQAMSSAMYPTSRSPFERYYHPPGGVSNH